MEEEIDLDLDGKILKQRINEAIKLYDSLNEILPEKSYLNFEHWLWSALSVCKVITTSEYCLLEWYKNLGKQ